MKILVVGNGGREHSICWKIYNSERFGKGKSKLYCTLGNPGINQIATPVNISPDDIEHLKDFAVNEKIDLTVVGPELPLSKGIVDIFEKNNLKIFGPSSKAAEIESSKIFAKKLMKKYGIPTAEFKEFHPGNYAEIKSFLKEMNYPVVIKADGLAAGKGVIIAENREEVMDIVFDFTQKQIFGESGKKFIIEEFLNGIEVSVLIVTDGTDFVVLPHSQDHKKIGEGDTGKNTGGMGAYSPVDKFVDNELMRKIRKEIIFKILKGMREEGRLYKGCLYLGLMIVKNRQNNEKKLYVIEFNCRFGDPETQSVLPLIKSDFLDLILHCVNNNIKSYNLVLDKGYCCCVVLSSEGYPGKYETGKLIKGLEDVDSNCILFHSGTKYGINENEILTNGGRVLSVVCKSEISLNDAVAKCYSNIDKIKFDNKYYRKDIAYRSL